LLTSIDAMDKSRSESCSASASNSSNIRNRCLDIRIGGHGQRPKAYPNFTYNEAVAFQKEFDFPALVSLNVRVTGGATVKFESEKTNPNITVQGSDQNFLETGGYKLGQGRNFTERELELGSSVVIIGSKIQSSLFKNNE